MHSRKCPQTPFNPKLSKPKLHTLKPQSPIKKLLQEALVGRCRMVRWGGGAYYRLFRVVRRFARGLGIL